MAHSLASSSNVTGKPTKVFSFSAEEFKRMLAALLLASIAWGATAEFTHNHGSRTRSLWAQSQAGSFSPDANESVQSSNRSDSTSRSKSAADCLICQLHQNLSNTLLGHAIAIASVETQSFGFNPELLLHRTGFSKSQRGRAPPEIL